MLTATKEPLIWLAPLALIAATLIGVVAPRVTRSGRRAWLSLAILVIVAGGAFFTWFSMMAPHASEHVEHHFAATAGTIALAAMILDALVRFILGVREWWVARRARRASMLRATHGVGP